MPQRKMSWLVMVLFIENFPCLAPMHYAAIPIKRGQLEIWARFLPLPPFWSSLIISDKIFEWIFVFSFTFNIYLMDKLTISQSSLPIYLMTLMVTMPKHKQCFKHVRTSWTLASEQYIKYFRQWKYYVKYLYISNSVLTMMLAPDKKIFWGVFF